MCTILIILLRSWRSGTWLSSLSRHGPALVRSEVSRVGQHRCLPWSPKMGRTVDDICFARARAHTNKDMPEFSSYRENEKCAFVPTGVTTHYNYDAHTSSCLTLLHCCFPTAACRTKAIAAIRKGSWPGCGCCGWLSEAPMRRNAEQPTLSWLWSAHASACALRFLLPVNRRRFSTEQQMWWRQQQHGWSSSEEKAVQLYWSWTSVMILEA